jgi:hypothetical protein
VLEKMVSPQMVWMEEGEQGWGLVCGQEGWLVSLPDGRLEPLEAGGMVELALRELGARVVEIGPAERAG